MLCVLGMLYVMQSPAFVMTVQKSEIVEPIQNDDSVHPHFHPPMSVLFYSHYTAMAIPRRDRHSQCSGVDASRRATTNLPANLPAVTKRPPSRDPTRHVQMEPACRCARARSCAITCSCSCALKRS